MSAHRESHLEGRVRFEVTSGIPVGLDGPRVQHGLKPGNGVLVGGTLDGREADPEFLALELCCSEDAGGEFGISFEASGVGKELKDIRRGPAVSELSGHPSPLGKRLVGGLGIFQSEGDLGDPPEAVADNPLVPDGAEGRQGLVLEIESFGKSPLSRREAAFSGKGERQQFLRARALPELACSLERGRRLFGMSIGESQKPVVSACQAELLQIPQLFKYFHRTVKQPSAFIVAVLSPRHAAGANESRREGLGNRFGIRASQNPFTMPPGFLEIAADLPVSLQCCEQAKAGLGSSWPLGGPFQGKTKIKDVGRQRAEGWGGMETGKPGGGFPGSLEEVAEVAVLQLGHFSRAGELLACVLPDGLQQGVARAVAVIFHEDQGLVGQLLKEIEKILFSVGANRLHGIQRPPAGKDAQALEKPLFWRREQVVAPVDECPEGLLMWKHRMAFDQFELVVQAIGNLPRAQHPKPRSGQLQGERDPIQSPTDPCDVSCVLVRQLKLGDDGPGAIEEEVDGVVASDVAGTEGPVAGAVPNIKRLQRAKRESHLAGDVQSLSAGGKDMKARAGGLESFDFPGDQSGDVLTVVQ